MNLLLAERAAKRAAEAATDASEEIRERRSFPDARRLLASAKRDLDWAEQHLAEDGPL